MYGAVSSTLTQGELMRFNINANGNYRSKKINIFGTAGGAINDNFHNIIQQNYQNGLYLDEIKNNQNNRDIFNARIGSDFFLHKNHTAGFVVTGRKTNGEEMGFNQVMISPLTNQSNIDSVLIANNSANYIRKQNTYNLNYRFYNDKRQSLNVDLDYGKYQNERTSLQPNQYFNVGQDSLLSEVINAFDTPTDIDIYTGKLDFETPFLKGVFGMGTKYSRVETKNTFTVNDVVNDISIIDSSQSNDFNYDEKVYAGYINYSHPIGKKFNISAGVRAEQTDATGDLIALLPQLQEAPIQLKYLKAHTEI